MMCGVTTEGPWINKAAADSLAPGLMSNVLRMLERAAAHMVDESARRGDWIACEYWSETHSDLLAVKHCSTTIGRTHQDASGCWVYVRDGFNEGGEECVQIY